MSRESFLERWSRRKLSARHDPPVEPAPSAKRPVPPIPSAKPEPPLGHTEAKPALPPLDSVSLDTGVAAFFRPEVEEGLRRQALKKLFGDPHFNTMDGLDVYIDDYTKADPIPPDILKRLVRAQTRLGDQDTESAKENEIPLQPDSPVADAEAPSQGSGMDRDFEKV